MKYLRSALLPVTLLLLLCLMPMSVSAQESGELSYGTGAVRLYNSAATDTPVEAMALDESLVEYVIDAHRQGLSEIPIYDKGYRINKSELYSLQQERMYDAPDLFYVSNQYGYSEYSDGTVHSIIPVYTMSGSALEEAKAEYEEMIDDITLQAAHLESELEIALFYHEYIVANFEYDTDYEIYDAYTMLKTREGVCQAYTLLYTELLERAGIGNVAVVSDGLVHAWNAIELDGEWFLCDLTWDDPVPNTAGYIGHTYFLRSASSFGHALSDGSVDWYEVDGVSRSYSSRYDNAIWTSAYTWMHVYDGALYYYDAQTTYLCAYSFDSSSITELFTIDTRAVIHGTGSYNQGVSFGLCGYGDRLYFAEYIEGGYAIYEYSVTDAEKTLVESFAHTCTDTCYETCVLYPMRMYADSNVIYYVLEDLLNFGTGSVYSFEAEEYVSSEPILMDVDGDGEVTNTDIAVYVRYLSGWNTELVFECADVNTDGKYNNRDVIAIIKYLLA